MHTNYDGEPVTELIQQLTLSVTAPLLPTANKSTLSITMAIAAILLESRVRCGSPNWSGPSVLASLRQLGRVVVPKHQLADGKPVTELIQ